MSNIITHKGRQLRPTDSAPADVIWANIAAIVRRCVPDAEIREETVLGLTFSANVERGWGCGATLRVGTVLELYDTGKGTQGRPDTQGVHCLEPVSLSWSAAGHSVSSALCALTLYRSMTEAAAEIDTVWGRTFVFAGPQ